MDELEQTWTERDLTKIQLAQMYQRQEELEKAPVDASSEQKEALKENIAIGERTLVELDALLQELSVRKDNPDDD